MTVGALAGALTLWYAAVGDFVSVPALQSADWAERANRVGLAQLLLNLEAIAVAGLSVLYVWNDGRRRELGFRIEFLRALRDELQLNLELVRQVPRVGDFGAAPAVFWDPTLQEFRLRDNATTYAIIEGQARLHLSHRLLASLLGVSHWIRFANQQIGEVTAFRFNSPEMLARVSGLARADPSYVVRLAQARSTSPAARRTRWNRLFRRLMRGQGELDPGVRTFANELAFRHWALNYFGFANLLPLLEETLPLVETELRTLGDAD